MKKILLLPILFILCISFAVAANFQTEVTIVKDSIDLDESAQFILTIKSNSTEQEEFRIYSPDVEWNVPTKTIIVEPLFEITEELDITPTKHIKAGVYGVHLNVKQDTTGNLEEKLLFVNVQGSGEDEYNPAVKMEVDMIRQTNPREPFIIRINLENQNILNLSNMTMVVSSDLMTLNRKQIVELGSLEQKVVSFSYELDPVQQPKAYQVSFALVRGNQTIASSESRTLEIVSVTPGFASSFDTQKGFMKSVMTATYTNEGNVRNTQKVMIPISWFALKFTRTDADVVKEGGQRYLSKELQLGPNESATLTSTTNYRIILYIIIVLIIILILYLKFRKRLKIAKNVTNISTEEGGISQLKIMIDVVNTSNKELKDVKIVDVVPTIADVKKEFAEGTLKPASILKHSSKGTILKWSIPELAPGEERLISYDIRSKLSIIGNFSLPKTRIKYIMDGKEKTNYSNNVSVTP